MLFKNTLLVLFVFVLNSALSLASDLPIIISEKLDSPSKIALEKAFNEVSELLPVKFKKGLPEKIQLKVKDLSDHQAIPADVCSPSDEDNKKHRRPFVYGEYDNISDTLILNKAVVNELIKGRSVSTLIKCQHKSLYGQAISSIIHELAHAYDSNNSFVSSSYEFSTRADFKLGFFGFKSKNKEAMRSADPYEVKNVAEAYAVNMEYFTMDPEFACRKPALFEYFKQAFESDPFLNRNCSLNKTVMMSTASGFYPMKLDVDRIYRIDYLLASSGSDVSSGFGHSMYRIIVCAPEHFDPLTNKTIPATPYGPKCLEDKLFHLVVSYRANVEDAKLNYMKGMFGGYPSMLFILSFGDVLDEYNKDELRDISSYALNLSKKEKEKFVNKVLEEHWNYRGSYKFITNNCAVESLDLLKGALGREDLQEVSSLSPKGVLKKLNELKLLSSKNGSEENFKAHTESLIMALKIAYNYKLEGNAKKDNATLVNFIDKTMAAERFARFQEYEKKEIVSSDLHVELTLLKESLIRASSFSVMEQQILRKKAADFRKKAAELFSQSDNPNIKKILELGVKTLKQDMVNFSSAGYGVPLISEMISEQSSNTKMEQAKEVGISIEKVLKELMPNELANIDAINANIKSFNQKSLDTRRNYRKKLDFYIHQVITNLSMEDSGRTLLIDSLNSHESLVKVRELLDNKLISEKEVLDGKLINIIQEILG